MEETSDHIGQQLTLFEPQELVRPDVNIGKWAGFIFISPYSRSVYEEREKKFKYKKNEEVFDAAVVVTPGLNKKTPTTTTMRTFIGLIQIWEMQGKPEDGEITFSARQLAGIMGWKWGGRTAERIGDQMRILTTTTIRWDFSYQSPKGRERIVEDMHLVDSSAYVERRMQTKGERFTGLQTVRLNRDQVRNMIAGKTKPLRAQEIVKIGHDSALNLYTLLDTYLAKKTAWSNRAQELLVETLGYAGERYKQKKHRKAKLNELVKELDGLLISTGRLKMWVAETQDKKDVKLEVRKQPTVTKKRTPHKLMNPADEISDIVSWLQYELNEIQSGGIAPNPDTLRIIAMWYPRRMLNEVLSIIRSDYRGKIKKGVTRLFMYELHVTAHQMGYEWIAGCKNTCRCRKENRLAM